MSIPTKTIFIDILLSVPDTVGMRQQLIYTHGETGIELHVTAHYSASGDITLSAVHVRSRENILPLLGEDTIVDIELFVENYYDGIMST